MHTHEQTNGKRPTLVIKRVTGGYEVFAPQRPHDRYRVAGENGTLACECEMFHMHHACEHASAVAEHEGSRSDRENPSPARNGVDRSLQGQLVLKRSVSPDGRIDSLSVEMSSPTGHRESPEAQAASILAIQNKIVAGFLGRRTERQESNPRPVERQASNGAQEAELLNIGGVDTRFGRRLFINVRCNGSTIKLFGSERKLADSIQAAGFPEAAEVIEEGIELHLPCMVTTKPSDDGRYVNVETVLPQAGPDR